MCVCVCVCVFVCVCSCAQCMTVCMTVRECVRVPHCECVSLPVVVLLILFSCDGFKKALKKCESVHD